jgi:rfaE bifunctional protein nucleotidyltransferase chain/domain
MKNKIIKTLNELENLVENLKKQNKKIVTTNGVFDILHVGHIRYLKEAKNFGDVLIVAINSDPSVKQLKKGPNRPRIGENERAEVLAALECVDYVYVFNEPNPIEVLKVIKPDVHVKGGDYEIEQIIEKDVVEKNNGRIELIPEVKGWSTTEILEGHKKLN